MSQLYDSGGTQSEKEARYGEFWDWYFQLVDSGWQPRDNDLQFDHDEERQNGWAVQ